MKCGLSNVERRILAVMQDGFPVSRTPYKDVAGRAGISTKKLFTVLEDWKKQGKIRRMGAVVNHLKIGLSANAMVVWKVEPERIEKVGTILAGFEEVSHCYERQTAENWPYNLYTMIHRARAEDIEQMVARMSEACGVSDYRVLFTEKELKKTPPRYIK
jgi:DNA-binding Lrp family transcriptional regulator